MATDGSAEGDGGLSAAQDFHGEGGPSAAEEPVGKLPSRELSLRLEAQSLAHMLTHKPKIDFAQFVIEQRQNKPLTFEVLLRGLCRYGVK